MAFTKIKDKGRVKVWKGSKDMKSAYKKQIGEWVYYYDSYKDYLRKKHSKKSKLKKKK